MSTGNGGRSYGLARKLEQHDERLDRVEHKLEEHDARFDRIETKLREHDGRFDRVDQRFDAVDQRFDAVDERFHRVELKLEKIQGDLQFALEAMQTGSDSLPRDLQTQIDDLKGRLNPVEIIVRQNSRDRMFEGTALHESWRAIQRNTGGVEEHARELAELKTAIERIEGTLDENDRTEVEALARRVAVLEDKVLGKGT